VDAATSTAVATLGGSTEGTAATGGGGAAGRGAVGAGGKDDSDVASLAVDPRSARTLARPVTNSSATTTATTANAEPTP